MLNLIKKIENNFISLINYILIIIKICLTRKKISFFFYSGLGYKGNLEIFKKKINKKKFIIFTIFSQKNKNTKLSKNEFIINHRFLRYLPFKVKLLISSSICSDIKTDKNVYFHHDIFDTPLGQSDIEIKNYKSYLVADYIFVSNESVKKKFINDFKNYFPKLKTPIIKVCGYSKITSNSKYFNLKYKKNNQIIIAPTNSRIIKDLNLSLLNKNNLVRLSNVLKKNYKNYRFVIRIHPNDKFDKKIILKNTCFDIDENQNNLVEYSKSEILITDISGTAYTYALKYRRPVIFLFNSNIKKIKNFLETDYYKNIYNIGIKTDLKNLSKSIKKINKRKIFFHNKVYKKYFTSNTDNIKKILNN